MKKLISILTAFALMLSLAVPVYGANPSATEETFTYEEMQALVLSSTVTYRINFTAVEGKVDYISGTVKPQIVPLEYDKTLYEQAATFIQLPISIPLDRTITTLSFVFNLPFTVTQCSDFYFGFTLCSYSNSVEYVINSLCQGTIQFDNNDTVVASFPCSIGAGNGGSSPLYDTYGRHIRVEYNKYGMALYYKSAVTEQNRYYPLSYFNSISSEVLKYPSIPKLSFNLGNNDITSFGMSFDIQRNSSNNINYDILHESTLGLIFSPIKIQYLPNGGYTPPDVVIPDDPIEPDPPKGEYSQQLDDIYNKLVENGEIQQQQNQDIINNQNEIKDKIDFITTPDTEIQQGVTDFENQVDENDKKLDEVTEGMKINVPDIETEVDTSSIDEALTDDNFKSIMAVFFDNTRLVSIFIVSFIVSIFGVIFRGKRA